MANNVALVNGDNYDWVGISISVLGGTIEGISSIDYDQPQAKQNTYGRGTLPVGRSRSTKNPQGSMVISETEYRRIVNIAGGDITNVPAFPISVFKKRGTKSTTDKLLFVEFAGQGQSLAREGMDNQVNIPLVIGQIIYGPEI